MNGLLRGYIKENRKIIKSYSFNEVNSTDIISIFNKYISILDDNGDLKISNLKSDEENMHIIKCSVTDKHTNEILLEAEFEYNTSKKNIQIKFISSSINDKDCEVLLNYFINFLKNSESKDFDSFCFFNDKERQKVLNFSNIYEKEKIDDRNLKDLIYQSIQKNQDKIALIDDKTQCTYRELKEYIEDFDKFIKENCSIDSEERIGIFLHRSSEYLKVIFSICCLGAAYVPMDTIYPMERLKYMIENSNIRILITNKREHKKFLSYFEEKKEFGDIVVLFNKLDKKECIKRVNKHNLAYILFTSGSTGNPKGVMVEQKSIINLVKQLKDVIYKRYNGRQLNLGVVAPFVFDISIQQTFPGIILGHTIYITSEEERKDGKKLVEFINRNKIDVIDCTPTHVEMINEILKRGIMINRKVHFVLCGEKLHYSTTADLVKLMNENLFVSNMYGPTECCVETTGYEVPCDNINNLNYIPIGRPIKGTRAYILDSDLRLLPIGVKGDLYLAGECTGRGYVNNKEKTSQVFIKDPFVEGEIMYKTGDIASWSSDGNIIFSGRSDNQVKLRGFRVELGEIEEKIKQLDFIEDACVKMEGNNFLAAYIVINNKENIDSISDLLLKYLPQYMIPQKYIVLEKMPLNVNGKIDRKKLTLDLYGKSNNDYSMLNECENKILKLFQETLLKDDINIKDTYFENGGDSLSAFKLVGRLYDEFGVEIHFDEIYRNNRIKEIEKLIINKKRSGITNEEKSKNLREYKEIRATVIQDQFLKNKNNFILATKYRFKNSIDKEKLRESIEAVIKSEPIFNVKYYRKRNKYYMMTDKENRGIIKEISYDEDCFKNLNEDIKNVNFKNNINYAFLYNSFNLFVIVDHTTFDFYSFNIIIKKIMYRYNNVETEMYAHNYFDYALWQGDFMKSLEYEEYEKYYVDEYDEFESAATLLEDKKIDEKEESSNRILSLTKEIIDTLIDDKVLNSTRKIMNIHLNSENIKKIYHICSICNCTKAAAILVLFQISIFKVINSSNIMFGIFNNGRWGRNYYNTIGNFSYAVPLVNKFNLNEDIIQYINRVVNKILKINNMKMISPSDIYKSIYMSKEKLFKLYNFTYNYMNFNIYKDKELLNTISDIEYYENQNFDSELNIIVYEEKESIDIKLEFLNEIDSEIIHEIQKNFIHLINF